MTFDRDDDEVRLGYKNPPPWSRFQKGQSGNPNGRPKKKPAPLPKAPINSAADDALREELNRKIRVNDANGSSEATILEVVNRSLANQAAKGNVHAQREILKQARALEERDTARKAAKEENNKKLFSALVDWRNRQVALWADAERKGVQPADPWPHPDDMHVDEAQGKWGIHGPSCESEVPMYEYFRAERDRLFVKAELRRRENVETSDTPFSALDLNWLIYDLLLPKRWQIQDNDDAWSRIATRTTWQLQAEFEQYAERAEQFKNRAKLPPRDKDGYRIANEALKPVIKASGYHSLAQFERVHASEDCGQS